MEWTTSASNRKVAVSDQLRAVTEIVRPPSEKSSFSILVNGHGPAMQETRASRNSLPASASRDVEPSAAFHLPSGEQGCWPWQGTSPLFSIWNVLTTLPTFTTVVALMVNLTRTFETVVTGPVGV